MEPEPFDGSLLGEEFARLRRPAVSALILGKFMITARIAKRMVMLDLPALFAMAWLFFLYLLRAPKRARLCPSGGTLATHRRRAASGLASSPHDPHQED